MKIKSRACFLLSVPRSGSSAIAGALDFLGVQMGRQYDQPGDILNPAYVEDRRWQRVHKEITGNHYTVRWMDATPVQLDAYRRLIAKCSREPIWGCKSPRLAFLFSQIWPLLQEAEVDIRVVWAHRDFESTVQSFKRHTEIAYHGRWPMTEDQARAHMEKWRKALVYQLATFPGLVYQVDYDRLLAEPVTELLDLFDYCYDGLDLEEMGRKRVITPALNWLDGKLRHFDNHSSDTKQGDGNVHEKPGTPSGWTRKKPCRGCRGSKQKRVDEEREQAPADEAAQEPELDSDG